MANSKKENAKGATEKTIEPTKPVYQDLSRPQLRDTQLPFEMATMLEGMDPQLQSSQVSSTVLDSTVSMYQSWNYQNEQQWGRAGWLDQRKNNWMNPWSEYGPFGGLEREAKVDPDSTSLDDTRPRSAMSQDDCRPASRNFQNTTNAESPRSNYNLSPRGHPISPRGSMSNLSSDSSYSTVRTGSSTPQDQRQLSPRTSGHSSASSEFNFSTPPPRNYQNTSESPQRGTPSKNNQYGIPPIGTETSPKTQSTNINQIRSPGSNLIDNYAPNIHSRYSIEQNQRYPGNLTLNSPETQNSTQNNSIFRPTSQDYLHNPLAVPSLSGQNYDRQSDNLASHADPKGVNPQGAINPNYPSVSTEQSNWNSLATWTNDQAKRPAQSPSHTNIQQGSTSKFEYGNDTSRSWEQPSSPFTEPPSPFRVPKGRPPSRTNSNQVDANNQNTIPKTFLKPQEQNRTSPFMEVQANKPYASGSNQQRKTEWSPHDKSKEGMFCVSLKSCSKKKSIIL